MSDKKKKSEEKVGEETLEQFLRKIQKNKRQEREVLEKMLKFLDEQSIKPEQSKNQKGS